ncbi:Rv0361 family membrane protein [Nocardia sp. NPDC004123]
MSDAEETAGETSVPIDRNEARSMWPFLVAASVIAVVILGIVIATLVSPVEKNVTDSDRLAVAAGKFIEARSETGKYDPTLSCKGFDENASPLKDAAATGATITFDKLADPAIDGEKATAQVTFTVSGAQTTSTWHFTRENSRWLVCNS